MNKQITVANVTTSIVEYKGTPVVTTKQLADLYDCDPEHIQDNHRKNADRFEEGKHFVKLEGDALRKFKSSLAGNLTANNSLTGNKPVSPNTRNLILWTERGASRHAKMLSTERAWEVFEQLEDVYFRVKEVAPDLLRPDTQSNGLPQFRRARALDMATRTAERICAQFPSLGGPARQVIFAKIINPIAGSEVIGLPILTEHHYSASDVGGRCGITAAMVGRIANKNGIKTAEYGEFFLDKSPYSSKEVEAFRYNERGAARICELAEAAVADADAMNDALPGNSSRSRVPS